MMKRKEILEKAETAICKDREDVYGDPHENFASIALLWSVYKDTDFDAKDVPIMLALVKIARMTTGKHKEDNYIDLVGYAALAGEIADPEVDMDNIVMEKTEELQNEDKTCLNCKYAIWPGDEKPCCNCNGCKYWRPEE